jgi:hypothetical protein
MESRSGDALEEEDLYIPTEGLKMGVPNPCDVMAEK